MGEELVCDDRVYRRTIVTIRSRGNWRFGSIYWGDTNSDFPLQRMVTEFDPRFAFDCPLYASIRVSF
jgi:hypothetical protein